MQKPRWVLVTYLLVIVIGLVAVLPNLLPASAMRTYLPFLPSQGVTLGLDLRGGSHLVLEVDAAALKTAKLQSLLESARSTLAAQSQPSATAAISGDEVIVSGVAEPQREAVVAALRGLAQPVGLVGLQTAADMTVSTDGDVIHMALTPEGVADRLNAALEQSLEIIRQRIDQVGVAEPSLQRVGSDRILVQLPGLQDPTRLRELLGSTAQMSFHMLDTRPGADETTPGVMMLPDAEGNLYPVEERVAISGERLADARAGFDQQTGLPIVTFRFDAQGAVDFGDITRANVGKPFAIVLDDQVLTAPVIQEPIMGGTGQIRGDFTTADATVLSALLRSGALPAPLTVIEERTVGPNLGSDSIAMGLTTGLVGFGLVVGLMVVLYGAWGLVANLALGLNVLLTLGALTLLGATLTLPGIAGIILSIGLAVDANILINSRIREETARGASAFKALDVGFSRAYSTIVDANVTTLFATTLLYFVGTGPVRGFAVTMMLGILISMFTAVAIVRVIMIEIVRRRRIKRLEIKPLLGSLSWTPNFAFLKGRFIAVALSAVLSIGSLALLVTPGLNYGIDFTGGIQVEASAPAPIDQSALRQHLGGLGLGDVALQSLGDANSVLVRVQRQEGGEAAQTAALQEVQASIRAAVPDASLERSEVVGPTVSGELARTGMLASGLAVLAMLAYIWWRFEWNFAIGAIAVLVLDVTKTVGFMALIGIDFNLTAVAALLTMIGYSVNDKVVVYDRVRENLRLYRKMPFAQLLDMSLNQVLARCLFTSLTTFLALLPMGLIGGPAVASFAVPLLFGVIVATTSSLFIAPAILLFLQRWWHRAPAPAEIAAEPASGQP